MDSGLRVVTVDAKPAPPRGEDAFAADVLQVLGEVNCGARCQLWAKSDALVHETNAISSGTTRTGYVLTWAWGTFPVVDDTTILPTTEGQYLSLSQGMLSLAQTLCACACRTKPHFVCLRLSTPWQASTDAGR